MSTRAVSMFLLVAVLFGFSTVLFAEAPAAAPDLSATPEVTSQTVQAPFHVEPIDVQKALAQAGFFKGKLDGIIGKRTRAAIRAFQEANGLKADGRCGPLTWEKLKQYAGETAAAPAASLESGTGSDTLDTAEDTAGTANHELKQKLVS